VTDIELLPQPGRIVLVVLPDGRQLEGELRTLTSESDSSRTPKPVGAENSSGALTCGFAEAEPLRDGPLELRDSPESTSVRALSSSPQTVQRAGSGTEAFRGIRGGSDVLVRQGQGERGTGRGASRRQRSHRAKSLLKVPGRVFGTHRSARS
jgi:hypothetical protein